MNNKSIIGKIKVRNKKEITYLLIKTFIRVYTYLFVNPLTKK